MYLVRSVYSSEFESGQKGVKNVKWVNELWNELVKWLMMLIVIERSKFEMEKWQHIVKITFTVWIGLECYNSK